MTKKGSNLFDPSVKWFKKQGGVHVLKKEKRRKWPDYSQPTLKFIRLSLGSLCANILPLFANVNKDARRQRVFTQGLFIAAELIDSSLASTKRCQISLGSLPAFTSSLYYCYFPCYCSSKRLSAYSCHSTETSMCKQDLVRCCTKWCFLFSFESGV